jgi:dTDP-4-dehydrorhamnose reductase
MVYISTDFIFDGIAGAPYPVTAIPAPLNVYGMTKWEGEKLALATRDALIVRTSWLYGKTGKSFPSTVLKLAETRDEIRMVDDQKGSPTYSADLAEAILKLVDKKAAGIFHVSNSGHCTWFEFARAALELKGITRVKLTPTTSAEFNAPAKRPADSRLDCSRYAETSGAPMRPWRDALAEYLKVR